jgi:predicted RNase H-like HicB family nuclease
MYYTACISYEGKHILIEFPDCPGCQTCAVNEDTIAVIALEALDGWLEAHLASGQVPPQPRKHTPAGMKAGMKAIHVPIRLDLAAALQIRWAEKENGP